MLRCIKLFEVHHNSSKRGLDRSLYRRASCPGKLLICHNCKNYGEAQFLETQIKSAIPGKYKKRNTNIFNIAISPYNYRLAERNF